jgi:Rad3-related DNA helicase
MAVARGKFAEGFNFKNDLCRGLFMIGVPNLDIKSAKV